jgi:hypothetical protein
MVRTESRHVGSDGSVNDLKCGGVHCVGPHGSVTDRGRGCFELRSLASYGLALVKLAQLLSTIPLDRCQSA